MRLYIIAAAVVTFGLMGPSAGQDIQASTQDSATSVTVLGTWQVDSILGKDVRSKTGENMGRLVDVIVDRGGRPRAGVIDFGGFLGVGSRKVALDWNTLSFEPEDRGVITVDMTLEQVRAAPEYKDKRAVLVFSSAGPASPAD